MPRQPVFYSFHYANDVFRVQQIRYMGVVEGDEPVTPNDWEEIKRKGDAAVEKWIDENMKYKRCVVVLIGSQTYERKYVQYEIKRAWELNKGLFGIYIHNLKCPRQGTCNKGPNPFDHWKVGEASMSSLVRSYEPNFWDAYGDISNNLSAWVEAAIESAKNR